jgi:hypothetical protein
MSQKYNVGPVVEVLKNIGVVAGSLGSLAVLFFWIGNAIIVARLRAYNLYGVVHYTDEYVKEAGYQFFQDIFTYFQRWELILLFILATSLVLALIPIGPFSPEEKRAALSKRAIVKNPLIIVGWIRHKAIHYILFLCLALSANISLTSNWAVRNLSSNISCQERLLSNAVDVMKNELLVFAPIKDNVRVNEFQQRFYERLIFGENPTRDWLSRSLSELYSNTQSSSTKTGSPSAMIERFQRNFEINEAPEFGFNGDFEKSITYRTLLNIRLNNKLHKELYTAVKSALLDIRQLLSAHLTSQADFSSLVIIPANYKIVNNSIQKIKMLRKNIFTFFRPVNEESKKIMADLSEIKPIHFGSVLLSYSFWVLIGLLVYLLLNIPRVLKFKHWEIGYFFLMLFLFLAIAITLPTAYGRYKFEFKIQKLNDIIFATDGKADDKDNPIKKKLNYLWDNNAKLYILGPTKGREVIVGALQDDQNSHIDVPQIIMLERDTYNLMNVEPINVEDIPRVIRMLRYEELRE